MNEEPPNSPETQDRVEDQPTQLGFSEDDIQEMIALAARLREQEGGDLDETALLAVAEATGAPIDYIRLAVRSVPDKMSKRSLIQQIRSSFLAFEPDTRRYVAASILGLVAGFFMFLNEGPRPDQSGFTAIVSTMMFLGAIWNAAVSRSVKTAAFSGALTGAVSQISLALFSYIASLMFYGLDAGSSVFSFLFATSLGAFAGGICYTFFSRNRKSLGFSDPIAERQALLHQLVDIQSKLRSDERNVTFLSVDVVGSTEIKLVNDPLAVEFTFNEYHLFIESLVAKFGGKIHSTAGDGVTVVFEDPRSGYRASKAVLGGLFEFNAFRNKLSSGIQLRAGLHTGNVLAPGKEATAVNFASVIDIAAHMQKVAPIGGLAVSQTTAAFLGGLNAVGPDRVTVQNVSAAIWQPAARSFNPSQTALSEI